MQLLAVLPPISTIPCKTFCFLADPMLPTTSRRSGNQPLAPNSFLTHTCAKSAHKFFRMNTSKAQDLKPLGIRTYRKAREGAPLEGHRCRICTAATMRLK
jgi:hypothetical protein